MTEKLNHVPVVVDTDRIRHGQNRKHAPIPVPANASQSQSGELFNKQLSDKHELWKGWAEERHSVTHRISRYGNARSPRPASQSRSPSPRAQPIKPVKEDLPYDVKKEKYNVSEGDRLMENESPKVASPCVEHDAEEGTAKRLGNVLSRSSRKRGRVPSVINFPMPPEVGGQRKLKYDVLNSESEDSEGSRPREILPKGIRKDAKDSNNESETAGQQNSRRKGSVAFTSRYSSSSASDDDSSSDSTSSSYSSETRKGFRRLRREFGPPKFSTALPAGAVVLRRNSAMALLSRARGNSPTGMHSGNRYLLRKPLSGPTTWKLNDSGSISRHSTRPPCFSGDTHRASPVRTVPSPSNDAATCFCCPNCRARLDVRVFHESLTQHGSFGLRSPEQLVENKDHSSFETNNLAGDFLTRANSGRSKETGSHGERSRMQWEVEDSNNKLATDLTRKETNCTETTDGANALPRKKNFLDIFTVMVSGSQKSNPNLYRSSTESTDDGHVTIGRWRDRSYWSTALKTVFTTGPDDITMIVPEQDENNDGSSFKSFKRSTAQIIFRSWGFEIFCWVSIFVNCVAVILDTTFINNEIYGCKYAHMSHVCITINIVLLFVFAAEVMSKMSFMGPSVLFTDIYDVNDCILAFASVIPFVSFSEVYGGNDPVTQVFRKLPILRILRIFRFAAVFRYNTLLRDMWILFRGVNYSLRVLVWGVILLFICVFIFAVFATTIIGFSSAFVGYWHGYNGDLSIELDSFTRNRFGTVGRSLQTLFQVTTFDDWSNIVGPVTSVQPWLWVFFIAFIAVTVFAIWNLMAAVIVESAFDFARDDQTRMELDFVKQCNELSNKLIKIAGKHRLTCVDFMYLYEAEKMMRTYLKKCGCKNLQDVVSLYSTLSRQQEEAYYGQHRGRRTEVSKLRHVRKRYSTHQSEDRDVLAAHSTPTGASEKMSAMPDSSPILISGYEDKGIHPSPGQNNNHNNNMDMGLSGSPERGEYYAGRAQRKPKQGIEILDFLRGAQKFGGTARGKDILEVLQNLARLENNVALYHRKFLILRRHLVVGMRNMNKTITAMSGPVSGRERDPLFYPQEFLIPSAYYPTHDLSLNDFWYDDLSEAGVSDSMTVKQRIKKHKAKQKKKKRRRKDGKSSADGTRRSSSLKTINQQYDVGLTFDQLSDEEEPIPKPRSPLQRLATRPFLKIAEALHRLDENSLQTSDVESKDASDSKTVRITSRRRNNVHRPSTVSTRSQRKQDEKSLVRKAGVRFES